MQRRIFLAGAAFLAAGAGLRRLPQPGAGPAFDPWRKWPHELQEGLHGLIHAAVLSANAFNTQPWLFRLEANAIDVYADTARNLGAFDPYLREMYFSLGCALENLEVTAPAHGFRASRTLVGGSLERTPKSRAPWRPKRPPIRRCASSYSQTRVRGRLWRV